MTLFARGLAAAAMAMSAFVQAQTIELGPPADTPLPIDSLSQLPYRRTFAAPVASGPAETLTFERDGSQARVWRLDWRHNLASPVVLNGLVLQEEVRYSAAVTSAGLWLVGPQIVLIRPSGERMVAPFDGNEPTVVALKNGDVFVLGRNMHNASDSLRRLIALPDRIEIKNLASPTDAPTRDGKSARARYGVAATQLVDGTVLLAGGSADETYASVVDPMSGAVRPAAAMPHRRTWAALLRLPDGRVLAAGNEHLRCYDEGARTVDIYDPKQNAWTALPSLPFPLCADAYGATGPSAALMPDGTAVLGGHLERHILALRPDASSPTGYATRWEIADRLARQRISGVLQAISNTEVVVAGGVHVDSSDRCCSGTPGADRVMLPRAAGTQDNFGSFGLPLQDAAVARRGRWVFVASGRIFSSTGFGQMRYSSLAEMIDLSTGTVKQLPPLPFVSGGAQALWLDDERVLVKGMVPVNRTKFTWHSLDADLAPSSGATAIYDLRKQRWSTPLAIDVLNDTQLIGASGDDAWFANPSGHPYRLSLSDGKAESANGATTRHINQAVRRLADGRIVFSGGTQLRLQTISAIDDACMDQDDVQDCPERLVGWGPEQQTSRYETYTPQSGLARVVWSLSVPGLESTLVDEKHPTPDEVRYTAIDHQGRVIRLVATADAKFMLERSSPDGQSWKELPLPPGHTCDKSCKPLLISDPRQPSQELLFLREGNLENDWSIDTDGVTSINKRKRATRTEPVKPAEPPSVFRVWWFDEVSSHWYPVLQASLDDLRRKVLALAPPLSSPISVVQSLGWHLQEPVIWIGSNPRQP